MLQPGFGTRRLKKGLEELTGFRIPTQKDLLRKGLDYMFRHGRRISRRIRGSTAPYRKKGSAAARLRGIKRRLERTVRRGRKRARRAIGRSNRSWNKHRHTTRVYAHYRQRYFRRFRRVKPELLIGHFTNDSIFGTAANGYYFRELQLSTGVPINPLGVDIELPNFWHNVSTGAGVQGCMPPNDEDLAIASSQAWRVQGDKFDILKDTLHCKFRTPALGTPAQHIGPQRKQFRMMLLYTKEVDWTPTLGEILAGNANSLNFRQSSDVRTLWPTHTSNYSRRGGNPNETARYSVILDKTWYDDWPIMDGNRFDERQCVFEFTVHLPPRTIFSPVSSSITKVSRESRIWMFLLCDGRQVGPVDDQNRYQLGLSRRIVIRDRK